MKALVTILTILVATATVNAQISSARAIHYGMEFATINSGSGHGTNFAMNFNAQNELKSFQAGLILNNGTYQVKGAEFKYKIFPGSFDYHINNISIKPFLSYNMLYQTESVMEATQVETYNSGTISLNGEKAGKVATMEHYAGAGLTIKFMRSFYFDAGIGVGAYFGSLSKEKSPETVGIHEKNHGFTTSFNFGFGYVIF
ncbi:MAG: hypothetical protein HC896_12280 [Bacteroidales bacterium]|nr:hypothetical protein [Bacteroidales bacterium]